MHRRNTLHASLLLLFSAGLAVMGGGCSSDETACDADIPDTIATFVPGNPPVHCRDAKAFKVDGREVRLTHVEYGVQNDCPAGCFSSHLCAIEDPNAPAPQLFYAAWYQPDERPNHIDTECPTLTDMDTETYPACVPSGLKHPVVATSEFRAFAESETASGPMRWCVSRYVHGGWP